MAATVVDELVVILGLDASKFSEGQKKVAEEFVRLKQNASRETREAKTHADSLTQSFSALQGKLLGITALFLGGMGIQQFGQHVANLTNQLGRMSSQMDVSAAELSAWGHVGGSIGANPNSVRSGIASLSAAANDIKVNPQFFQALAVMGINDGHPYKLPNGDIDMNRTLLGVSEFVGRSKAAGIGNAKIRSSLNTLPGMNDDLAQTLMNIPTDKLRTMLADFSKFGPTPEQVKAIQDVNSAWATLQTRLESLANIILKDLAPGLEKVIKLMTGFVEQIAKDLSGKGDAVAPPSTVPGVGFVPGMPDKMPAPGRDRLREWWNGMSGSNLLDNSAHASTAPGGAAPTGGALPRAGANFTGKKAEVMADIKSQFGGAGVPDSGVAAILANVQRESGFNPNLRHPDQPKWSGEAHYAHGLYQEGGAEWNNYAAWLDKNHPGRSWQDPNLQTAFLVENLQKNYPKVWAALKNPNLSAGQKAMIFQSGYLRPAQLHHGDAAVANQFLSRMPSIPSAGGGASGDIWSKVPTDGIRAQSANIMGNTTSTTSNQTSNQTTVGEVNVHVPSGDPYSIARGIHGALINTSSVAQSNTGPW